MDKTNLLDAPECRELKIIEINAGEEARMRLHALGLHVDDRIVRVNKAWWGPVLLSNLSSNLIRIAVGRSLAKKIFVREYADSRV